MEERKNGRSEVRKPSKVPIKTSMALLTWRAAVPCRRGRRNTVPIVFGGAEGSAAVAGRSQYHYNLFVTVRHCETVVRARYPLGYAGGDARATFFAPRRDCE